MARTDASAAADSQRAAPAKLNLYLHVTGRRDDGYHLLDSLVVFAGACDILRFAPADDLSLTLDGPFAGALADQDDNLVLRAARLLAERGGVAARAAIHLEKHLPVAAGLGGGSADAAAALRGLAALWKLSPGPDELAAMALTLGADVPACLAGRATFMGGIGESLEPPPALPEAHVALVNPGVGLATAAVFGARHGAFSEPARFCEAPVDAKALAGLLAERANDLEGPARRFCPAVATALEALGAEPGCLLARMSGSGATCFGLFADGGAAAAAVRHMAAERPNWWFAAAAPLHGPSGVTGAA